MRLVTHQGSGRHSQTKSEVRHFSVYQVLKFLVHRGHLGSNSIIKGNNLRGHTQVGVG